MKPGTVDSSEGVLPLANDRQRRGRSVLEVSTQRSRVGDRVWVEALWRWSVWISAKPGSICAHNETCSGSIRQLRNFSLHHLTQKMPRAYANDGSQPFACRWIVFEKTQSLFLFTYGVWHHWCELFAIQFIISAGGSSLRNAGDAPSPWLSPITNIAAHQVY